MTAPSPLSVPCRPSKTCCCCLERLGEPKTLQAFLIALFATPLHWRDISRNVLKSSFCAQRLFYRSFQRHPQCCLIWLFLQTPLSFVKGIFYSFSAHPSHDRVLSEFSKLYYPLVIGDMYKYAISPNTGTSKVLDILESVILIRNQKTCWVLRILGPLYADHVQPSFYTNFLINLPSP